MPFLKQWQGDRGQLLRRAVLAEKSVAECLAWTALAVAVPALLRFVIDQGQSGMPFVTFFPAMLLTTIFLGWTYGAATAFFTAVIANRLFSSEPVLFWTSVEAAALVASYVLTAAIVIAAGAALRRLVREQAEAQQREADFAGELARHSRALLATVHSLAQLTADHSETGEFADKFDKRIRVLGRASELQQRDPLQCTLTELVGAVTAPFRSGEGFQASGSESAVSPAACVPLALALHELCSNAARHGALSVPEGRVLLNWADDPALGGVVLRWKEQGGPPVPAAPGPRAGLLLLAPRAGLRDVKLRFEPDGVACELVAEGVTGGLHRQA